MLPIGLGYTICCVLRQSNLFAGEMLSMLYHDSVPNAVEKDCVDWIYCQSVSRHIRRG